MTNQEQAFTVAQALEFVTHQMEYTRERTLGKITQFQAQIAEGKSIQQAITWGSEVVEAEITHGFILRIERGVENGFDLIEILRERVERMEDELLSYRFSQGSTSAFANAVECAEAKATSNFCRELKSWLKIYDNAG